MLACFLLFKAQGGLFPCYASSEEEHLIALRGQPRPPHQVCQEYPCVAHTRLRPSHKSQKNTRKHNRPYIYKGQHTFSPICTDWHCRLRVVWGVGYIFKQQGTLLALVTPQLVTVAVMTPNENTKNTILRWYGHLNTRKIIV